MTARPVRWFRRFARATGGAIAVEFAFTFPILLTLLFGMVETYQLVLTQRRLNNSGASIGDVVGRRGTLDTPTETNIFAAAGDIMGTTASTPPDLRISQIVMTSNNTPKYEWSDVQGGFIPYAHCATAALTQLSGPNAPSLAIGSRVVVSEIQYVWNSPLSYLLKQPIKLYSITVLSPRIGSVTRNYGSSTAATCS